MAKNLTKQQWEARAEALEECAAHLEQSWTDDPVERAEGNVIARALLRKAEGYWAIADSMARHPDPRPIRLEDALRKSLARS